MDVHIEEVVTTVQVTDPTALLTPDVLDLVVAAVLARLEERKRIDLVREAELDRRRMTERQALPLGRSPWRA
jgi:uncharacterized protein (DUF2384 family)